MSGSRHLLTALFLVVVAGGSRSEAALTSHEVPPTGIAREEADDSPRWRFGVQYFQGTASSVGEIFTGDIDMIPQNGVRISAARMLIEDMWGCPLNMLAEGGVMWHNEKAAQSDLFQYTLALRFEWTRFPWSDCLRTRMGLSTGISYVDAIPVAEIRNRKSTSSRHLLHYLEFSLAFNCADLSRLSRLHRLGVRPESLEHYWLWAGIPHRSGARGLYGEDRNGEGIRGASNYFSIGIEAEF